uniref:Uncharacterized protein n=1 Tax=Romanomermis culicivorax TaxID=13658 RepID=A0A915IXY5_ROMCU
MGGGGGGSPLPPPDLRRIRASKMDINPLNNVILDQRIDIPITKHFEQYPVNDFRKDFFTSDVHKIYHIHFIIGLLTSIASSKGTFKNIFFRRVGNKNLRIFVVQGMVPCLCVYQKTACAIVMLYLLSRQKELSAIIYCWELEGKISRYMR